MESHVNNIDIYCLKLTFCVDSQYSPKNEAEQTHRWLVPLTVTHVPLLIHGEGRQGAVYYSDLLTIGKSLDVHGFSYHLIWPFQNCSVRID